MTLYPKYEIQHLLTIGHWINVASEDGETLIFESEEEAAEELRIHLAMSHHGPDDYRIVEVDPD